MKICEKGRLSCARVARAMEKCRHSDKQFPCDCRLAAPRRLPTERGEFKKDAENRQSPSDYVDVSRDLEMAREHA